MQLFNTLSRRREPLRTERPDRVTLYLCGPTVYNFAHIGNARPAVVFDVLVRLLRHDYPQVIYARNFTDVDDKIHAAAQAAGVPIAAITSRFIDAYHQDMQALGVLAPDLEPRVTDHIPAIIALVERLIERGHAYEAEGHVLFHVASYADYGQLSRRRTQDMLAGARVEVAPYKRDPLDFVLWKPSTAEQPGWDSPWGRGRPGWHVECSAMIGQHLGHTLDIHGGGQDLIFPHHENEIAQGSCAHGVRYCHTWVHNSFVTVDGQKMSKSLGNVLLVRDLLAQAPGEVIRLALLATHYRRPLDWSGKRLETARRTLVQHYRLLAEAQDVAVEEGVGPDAVLLDALRADLNASAALTRLRQLARRLQDATQPAPRARAKAELLASARLLGLLQQPPAAALATLQPVGDALSTARIEALIAQRTLARQQGDYARADALRATLAEMGVVLKDSSRGTEWRLGEKA